MGRQQRCTFVYIYTSTCTNQYFLVQTCQYLELPRSLFQFIVLFLEDFGLFHQALDLLMCLTACFNTHFHPSKLGYFCYQHLEASKENHWMGQDYSYGLAVQRGKISNQQKIDDQDFNKHRFETDLNLLCLVS